MVVISPSVNRQLEENMTVLMILMHFTSLKMVWEHEWTLLWILTLHPVRPERLFDWPFLSIKSCSREGRSCICWTLFDASGSGRKHRLCLS